jgi:hypothetical protein
MTPPPLRGTSPYEWGGKPQNGLSPATVTRLPLRVWGQ